MITATESGTVMGSVRRTSLLGASVAWGILTLIIAIAFIVDGTSAPTAGSGGRAGGSSSSSGTGSISKPALAPDEYQAVLTRVEQAVRPAVDRVLAATTLAEVDSARIDLATALRQQSDYIQTVTPPYQAREQHAVLESALLVWNRLEKDISSADVTKLNSCGVQSALQTQLYEARRDVYRAVKSGTYKTAMASFSEINLKFGELMLPLEPTAPQITDRRAANGAVVQRSGRRGSGSLRIKNGDVTDVAVLVASGNPAEPQLTVYVRSNSNATVTGIAGTYWVYFKSGSDWDAARRGFTRDCSFEKFDDSFDPNANWEISLEKTSTGNATTSTVPAF
ncbi:hypothetical protein [Frankia sp. CiP1_Cm_nod2]|uniref:hypothetical protein n=2 Tax=unclassified Frankia TaxID=2632575 RepID=UPI0020254FFD